MVEKHIAKVEGRSLPISKKHAVEVGSFIRRKPLTKAKQHLAMVLKQKMAVPLRRYYKDQPHRRGRGMAAGSYPIKATQYVLQLLNSVEKNAQHQGMDVDHLVIETYMANTAETRVHSGRHSGRSMRRAHITIEVTERKKEVKQTKKEAKK